MMDAGMVLFTSEKPFGTVLGGLKAEMTKLGEVKRSNDFSMDELPDTTGECDLFVDWSSPFRWRAVSCRLEDAGLVGHNSDGEEIRRYAASFKEGDKNRKGKVAAVLLVVLFLLSSGISGIGHGGGLFLFLLSLIVSVLIVVLALRPSVKAQKAVENLQKTVREAK